jgi:hypothetical protein
MDADISVPPKEVFDGGFASCPQFCRLSSKHGSLARNAGRVQRRTETRRRGGRDSEGEPSSANSDNVTVQRLSPLR